VPRPARRADGGRGALFRCRARRPTVTVAIIPGQRAPARADFNAQRRAVLDNHVTATCGWPARSPPQGKQPDFVICRRTRPTSTAANADAYAEIQPGGAGDEVPILIGGMMNGPARHVSTPRSCGADHRAGVSGT